MKSVYQFCGESGYTFGRFLCFGIQMRVIAGKYKGRRLNTLKNLSVRPTSDRVKESVFSIIRHQLVNATFLDLCAGSGNIGIEALSQGAKQVTFLDRNRKCIRMIEQNLESCGLDSQDSQVQLLLSDAFKGIHLLSKQKRTFQLIYFDPPYDTGIYKKCISQISDTNVLESTGFLLIEHHKITHLPSEIGLLSCVRLNKYGDTCLSLYRY